MSLTSPVSAPNSVQTDTALESACLDGGSSFWTVREWCDRVLLDRLRALDEDALLAALGGYLTRSQIQKLAARARLIVKHFDDRTAEKGEGSVLFDWLRIPDVVASGRVIDAVNRP